MSRAGKAAGAAAAVEFAPELLMVLLVVLVLFLSWYYAGKLATFFAGWTYTAKSFSNGTFDASTAWDSFIGYGKSMWNAIAGNLTSGVKISGSVGG